MLVRAALVIAALAGTAAASGWAVTPPAGWTRDDAGGAELAAKTRAAFFAGTEPDVEASVFESADGGRLVIQVLHVTDGGRLGTPERAVADWGRRLAGIDDATLRATRVVDGSAIADLASAATQITVHARREPQDTLHMLVVLCGEPGGGTACARVVESVRVAEGPEADEPMPWASWIAIGGALLVAIALVGWRLELRRR